MSAQTVLHIQVPGQTGKFEHFYRIEVQDARVDTLRTAITKWAEKPSDFEIGNKQAKPSYQRARRLAALKRDEEVLPGVAVDDTVRRALAE